MNDDEYLIFVISKESIIKDLESIGVNRGDHIGLSLSFKSVGYVKGGPSAFIDALLEIIGPEGTIMVPTYTNYFPI